MLKGELSSITHQKKKISMTVTKQSYMCIKLFIIGYEYSTKFACNNVSNSIPMYMHVQGQITLLQCLSHRNSK